MPQITFVKKIAPITVEAGDNLMRVLLDAGLPVASSCSGKGICSKCRIKIVKGAEGLPSETPFEKDLRARNQVGDEYRISCQTQVTSEITVDTNYW